MVQCISNNMHTLKETTDPEVSEKFVKLNNLYYDVRSQINYMLSCLRILKLLIFRSGSILIIFMNFF